MSNKSKSGFEMIEDLNKHEKIIFVSVLILMALFSLILTSFILFLNIINKEIREICGSFTISITFNYLIGSFWFLTVFILFSMNSTLPYSTVTCVFGFILPNYLVIQSQFNSFSILLNRFLLLRFPLKYNLFCSTKLTTIFVFFNIILSLSICFLAAVQTQNSKYICDGYIALNYISSSLLVFFSIAPCFPCFFLYLLILRIAQRHASSLETQTNGHQSISKSAKLTCCELLMLSLSWIIYAVIFFKIQETDGSVYSMKLASVMQLITNANSVSNSIIIITSNSKIKSCFFQKIFYWFSKKNRISNF